MGVALKDLISGENISLKDLQHKVLVVDSFNILYQFLTTIRGPDGSPLTNKNGQVTSHLIGLFSRLITFLENNIQLVFVFDGKVPDLKKEERERRKQIKIVAQEKYDQAVQDEDLNEMKKYASRTVRIDEQILSSSKKLLSLFGLPIIQAPSEGEAQAAHMVKNKDAYAVVSQDYDTLLYGSPRFIKNLSISGKKKNKGTLSYSSTEPQIIELSKVLNQLHLDRDQLIALSMLIGTDFNIKGIKGIGPKTGLKKVKEYEKDFDKMFIDLEWDYPYTWQEVFDCIKKMPVTDDYKIEFGKLDYDGIIDMLVNEYDFSEDRVKSGLDKISKNRKQSSLSNFF